MTVSPTAAPKIWSAAEFGRLIDINEKLVRRSIEAGDLPGYRHGNRFVIPDPAVQEYLLGRWVPRREQLIRELIDEVRVALQKPAYLEMLKGAA